MAPHHSHRQPPISPHAIAASVVALLALILGGCTALWSQTVLAFALAAMFLIFPPKKLPGLFPCTLAVAFVLLALSAFAPDAWLGLPTWKKVLVNEVGIPATPFRTLQPWLTAEALGQLFLGLLWVIGVLSWEWNSTDRRTVIYTMVIGVAVLAAITVIGFNTGWRFPGWEHAENRGWFPNRNQTANVLALAGILNYALLLDGLRKREAKCLGWLLPLLVIGMALVVAYSRAGIILFFAGIALWHVGMMISKKSVEMAAVALSIFVVLFSLFLLFGGTTLERFALAGSPTEMWESDFRTLVHKDAVEFSKMSPWLGVGVGNFAPIFAVVRNASAQPNETIHPESDWLWLACEMGWAAVGVVGIAIVWWLVKCIRQRGALTDPLRWAAVISVLMFIAHGVVDVAGHRLGSLFFATLFAGIACSSQRMGSKSKWSPRFMRIAGVLALILASWWMFSLLGNARWPTSSNLKQAIAATDQAIENGDLQKADANCQLALRIAPLNWQLYFKRGYLETLQEGEIQKIVADFQIARLLQPHWPYICLDEGSVWMAAGENDLCLEAWQQALVRAGDQSPELFRTMLDLSQGNIPVRESLRALMAGKPALLIAFLPTASSIEARTEISGLLLENPELDGFSENQLQALVKCWWQKGSHESLAPFLNEHPKMEPIFWPYLAGLAAEKGDFEAACNLANARAQKPNIPKFPPQPNHSRLQYAFLMNPQDFSSGYQLCDAQMAAEEWDDALATLQKLKQIPQAPKFINYVEAIILMRTQHWSKAWEAWQRYLPQFGN